MEYLRQACKQFRGPGEAVRQVVRKQIFKMIVSNRDNNIITSYPAGTHC